jgi:hypothetical protein
VSQVVELQSSKHEALTSNPSTSKRKEKEGSKKGTNERRERKGNRKKWHPLEIKPKGTILICKMFKLKC